MKTCATCRHFQPVDPERNRYMSGGWCDWKPPVAMRRLMWGVGSDNIPKPENETCSEWAAKP